MIVWYLDASLDLFPHLNDRLFYTTCEAACIHKMLSVCFHGQRYSRAMFELVVIIYEFT